MLREDEESRIRGSRYDSCASPSTCAVVLIKSLALDTAIGASHCERLGSTFSLKCVEILLRYQSDSSTSCSFVASSTLKASMSRCCVEGALLEWSALRYRVAVPCSCCPYRLVCCGFWNIEASKGFIWRSEHAEIRTGVWCGYGVVLHGKYRSQLHISRGHH
jgi:hypothetical protein